MHDQHDDPLARELSRLSQYSGKPTAIWQDAIDKHRHDQQQKVWVWVRRPAPALAAACLALLVAAVSLRPVGPVSPAGNAALSDAADRSDAATGARKLAAANNQPPDFDGKQLPRDISQNSTGFQNYNVRSNDLQNERYAPPSQGNAPARDAENTGIVTGGAHPAARPVESGSNLASRGGVNAPGYGVGGGGGGGPGGRTEHASDPDQGAGAPRPAAGMAPLQPAVAAAPSQPGGSGGLPTNDNLAAKTETAEKAPAAAGAKEAKADPLDQTATVRLTVSDVNRFYYKQVPELLDVKNGESIAAQLLEGADPKDASGGANLTLRVSEDRLPVVMEELRRFGSVQEVTTQLVSKEDRLKQIDALVAESEDALKKDAALTKNKSTPIGSPSAAPPGVPAGAAPAPVAPAAASKGAAPKAVPSNDRPAAKQEETLLALNRRRSQIEQGRDLATLNIVAVPEIQPPPAPLAPPPLPPPPATASPIATATAKPGDTAALEPSPAIRRTATIPPTDAAPTAPAATPEAPQEVALKDRSRAAGDDTSSGINPAFYWLPALAAAIAGLWWWRRTAGASEPPPQ